MDENNTPTALKGCGVKIYIYIENGYFHQSDSCHGIVVLSFRLKSRHHKFSHCIPSIHTNMLENPTE